MAPIGMKVVTIACVRWCALRSALFESGGFNDRQRRESQCGVRGCGWDIL
jgi:hypothetical protein